jgi:G3E family GTPase
MIAHIPTTLISGFLGVGKTTAITHLLNEAARRQERWAVVVNEFGRVGIDGATLNNGDDGALVQEIAGGCLCCAVGMHFQTVLPRFIRQARPDRLLIEPTGIGHLKGLVKILSNTWLSQALRLKASITLVDPRQFSMELVQKSPVYYDQLLSADVIVINKCDVADQTQIQLLRDFLSTLPEKQAIVETEYGHFPLEYLDLSLKAGCLSPSVVPNVKHDGSNLSTKSDTLLGNISFKSSVNPRPQRYESQGDGRFACGWIFPKGTRFSKSALMALFDALNTRNIEIERAKGIFQLNNNEWQLFNCVGHDVEIKTLNNSENSRIEFISKIGRQPDWSALEMALLASQLAAI